MSYDDENTPLGPVAIKSAENVPMARAIGNIVLEAQAHKTGMRALYEQLCGMTGSPPKSWGQGLVEEYERHVKRMQEVCLPELRTAVG